jgi:hypothetical protein
MAKVKDIINARSYKDDGLQRKFTDVIDTTRGLTDELYTNNVLKNLGTVPAWITGEGIAIADEPKIPTLSEIIKAAGIKDDAKGSKGERSALDKFLEDFTDPEKREKMRSNIESDEKLGELGWETAKDLWKQATLDKMNSEISEGYEKTLNEGSSTARIPLVGDVEMGDLGKALSIAGTYAQKFFTPRRYEAFARGEDPTWKDNIGDLAESGLMMVPASRYVGGISKVLGAIPKAGKYAQKALANNVVSNLFGNTVAPVLSEAMDAAMRGEDDPNTERQDFSLGDAIMGALTNIGVNYGLAQRFGRGGKMAAGELTNSAGGGMTQAVRKAISDFGKSRAERGLTAPTTRMGKILDVAEMASPTLLVNRWGNDKDAKIGAAIFNGIGATGIDPVKPIEEIRDDERTDMRNRKTAKELEGILKASDVLGLDSRDIGYIKAVQEDPSILTRGIAGKEGDDFKIWLLEKGHRLLRGTSAHRPLWDVE